MDTRDSKGRFTKGNPGGGRPKKKPTTLDLLRELSPQAVTCLGDLIHSDDDDIALRASIAILDLSIKFYKVNITKEQDTREKSHYAFMLNDVPLEVINQGREAVYEYIMQRVADKYGIQGNWRDYLNSDSE